MAHVQTAQMNGISFYDKTVDIYMPMISVSNDKKSLSLTKNAFPLYWYYTNCLDELRENMYL